MERVFHHQIWKEFLALMEGKPNTAENRGKAYCKLCQIYPEGLYHGYSYPNLTKGEDYQREIITGKRGEPGSISVNESEGPADEEEGLDLGSGAGSDEEEADGAEESQVILTVSVSLPLLYFFRILLPVYSAFCRGLRGSEATGHWPACFSPCLPRRNSGRERRTNPLLPPALRRTGTSWGLMLDSATNP